MSIVTARIKTTETDYDTCIGRAVLKHGMKRTGPDQYTSLRNSLILATLSHDCDIKHTCFIIILYLVVGKVNIIILAVPIFIVNHVVSLEAIYMK